MPLLSDTEKCVPYFLCLGRKSPALPPIYLPNITDSCTNRTKRTIKIESWDDSLTHNSAIVSPSQAGNGFTFLTWHLCASLFVKAWLFSLTSLWRARYCFCWKSKGQRRLGVKNGLAFTFTSRFCIWCWSASAHKQAEGRESCHRNVYKSRPEECKQSWVELLSDKE